MASQYPFSAAVDEGKLLSPLERKTCQEFCSADDEIPKKRAKALIALDDGCTQAKAGELSGLTRGQVNYLVTLFRKKGMDLFVSNAIVANQQKEKATSDDTERKPDKKTKKNKGKKDKKKQKKKKKDQPKKLDKKKTKKTKKKGKKKKGKKK